MRRPARRRPPCRGLTLLEVVVGTAVGLFVAAAASMLLSQFLGDNRRLLLQLRLQQQLHAAADVITRDLRRAGHWSQAAQGVASVIRAGQANPYAALDGAQPDQPVSRLLYAYAEPDAPETGPLREVQPQERAGFRLRDGTVSAQLGDGQWQPLTDPAVLTVTAFELLLHQHSLDLDRHCARPRPLGRCAAGEACPPRLLLRSIELRLAARAAQDAEVRHALQAQVRLPNDVVEGSCPQ